ncbi:acyl-CoA dehydrogenase [Sphingobium sp. SCG-1]|uniref:acyl-CoA dehydrogenase family protein n=1 Tax=Sphingobium sp. SCG-1 TaxID=2072936 RepID=UPI000CD68943|nr:acyl-CoA dehydrogenase family protein [Sphingobium sp. SCG-1]AUW57124.1 acyl-CoA dehydrogenase [Sphingobium sp. SCG-1]
MNLDFGLAAEEFRTEIQHFLKESWPPKGKTPPYAASDLSDFRGCATRAGYLYRNIPLQYGGSQQPVDVIRAHVIRDEFTRARAPIELADNGVRMLVPTLLEHGTDEQKELFIRPTIEGAMQWAQGYSEPGSGSDLASLRCKGEMVDGRWLIDGQKIWTSNGGRANHMFALVRTEPDVPKHAGISYLLINLDQPGIARRPIRQLTGEARFFEISFNGVTTPADWIVGKRGEGWKVSRSTLSHERASIGSAESLGAQFDKLVELARTTVRDSKRAIDEPLVRDALVGIEGWVLAHRYSSYRLFSLAIAKEGAGLIQLMMKVLTTETGHEIAKLALDLMGGDALIQPAAAGSPGRGPEKWLDQVMGSLGNSIAGGTTNIQRNIIGERGLGLPRDPAMGAGQ